MIIDFKIPECQGNLRQQELQSRFWSNIFNDIITHNKFDSLIDILNELCDFVCCLIPSRNDLHTEFKQEFDIRFLKQQFENHVFEYKEFRNLFTYLIEWTKKLGPPTDDDKMNRLLQDILNDAEQYGFYYILPHAYYTLYSQLDQIYQTTKQIRLQLQQQQQQSHNIMN